MLVLVWVDPGRLPVKGQECCQPTYLFRDAARIIFPHTKLIPYLVDSMSPDQHTQGKCRNPFCLPDFVSGSYARGTLEIVMSENSPRSLLLHIPPTDPPRRIYRLADSPQRDFGRPRWMVL